MDVKAAAIVHRSGGWAMERASGWAVHRSWGGAMERASGWPSKLEADSLQRKIGVTCKTRANADCIKTGFVHPEGALLLAKCHARATRMST